MKSILLSLACLGPALVHATPLLHGSVEGSDSGALYLTSCAKDENTPVYAVAAYYADAKAEDGDTAPDYACRFPDFNMWVHSMSSCPLVPLRGGDTPHFLVASLQRLAATGSLSGTALLDGKQYDCVDDVRDVFLDEAGAGCRSLFKCTPHPAEDADAGRASRALRAVSLPGTSSWRKTPASIEWGGCYPWGNACFASSTCCTGYCTWRMTCGAP